jgi:MipA family protein
MKPIPALLALLACALPLVFEAPAAQAQDVPQAEAQPGPPATGARNVFAGDRLLVGAGVIYGPSYTGSDDYDVSVIPVVQGSLGGVTISPRPAGLALDLIPERRGAKTALTLGPVATLASDRKDAIKDPVVRAAGRLDRAVELGLNAGIGVNGVLNRADSLSLSADVKWDVAGAHRGRIISPSIGYFTPLSRAAVVTVSASLKHVDADYARYYFSVSPEQATASGLPRFDAKSGLESWGLGMLAGYDLNGNAMDGGMSLFALTSYSRLLGDARKTPYTSLRGTPDQWTLALGLGYTF